MNERERVYWQAVANPDAYRANVIALRDRLLLLRERHTPEAAAGHPNITAGSRCSICVGLLQVLTALGSTEAIDVERVGVRLDGIEAAITALA